MLLFYSRFVYIYFAENQIILFIDFLYTVCDHAWFRVITAAVSPFDNNMIMMRGT